MNNSAYGNTMENLRKRIKVRLVLNAKEYEKHLSKPSFVSQKKSSKGFFTINEIKPAVPLDKPIYVGFSILGVSKYLVYEFHYKYIKRKCSPNLLFAEESQEITWSGNVDRKTPISFNLRKYVEKHCDGPQ